MKGNADFIRASIMDILKDAVSAASTIGDGIETFPLCHYVMQTTFLKMTGAQEQKMKCICWELACDDYEYRYFRFQKKRLDNCSTLDNKNIVYHDLISQIKKNQPKFNVKSNLDKRALLTEVRSLMEELLRNSNLIVWLSHDYVRFKKIVRNIEQECFSNNSSSGKKNNKGEAKDATNNIIFPNCDNCDKKQGQKDSKKEKCSNYLGHKDVSPNNMGMKGMYEQLYIFRNQCAHNTTSYQRNLPTLRSIANENYKFENYFLRFFLLAFIDSIVVTLFKKYEEIRDSSV